MKRTHQHPTSKHAGVILSEVSGFVPASRTTSRDFRFVQHDNMELAAWCRQLLWMLEIGGLVIKI